MIRGQRRDFAIGLLLCFVTLGIYPLYWHFTVFKELYDQERRQDFPVGIFLCCFVPFINLPAQLVFMSKQLDFVNDLRVRNGLAPILGLGEFVLWLTLGQLIIVGPFIAYAKLQGGINELWDMYESAKNKPVAPPVAMAA